MMNKDDDITIVIVTKDINHPNGYNYYQHHHRFIIGTTVIHVVRNIVKQTI